MIEDKVVFLSDRFTNSSDGCEKSAGQQESDNTRSLSAISTSVAQPLPARYCQDLVVPDELETVMSQVKVMQDAMSFLSTNTEKISEKLLIMEQCSENLSAKYSKEGQEKLKEIERELKNISEKQKETIAQQDKRITSLENKMEAVTDAQSEINENHQLQKAMMKEQKKENSQHLKQSEQFTQDLNAVLENVQELNGRICLLGNQGLINTELEALNNTKLQKFEEKIIALEMSWSDKAEKRFKDVENKYQMVCQVIADRLVPLERLRVIFNEKLDDRRENMKKLDNVCDQMADLLPKLSQLETKNKRRAIGFSAHVNCAPNPFETVKDFSYKLNNGNHFNPTTGVFTAPMEGLYGSFLSVRSKEHGSFAIIKQPCKSDHDLFPWCGNCTMVRILMNEGIFVVIDMKPGETLVVRRWNAMSSVQYDITFTCFRIG